MNKNAIEQMEADIKGHDFSKEKIAIIIPYFNQDLTEELLENCLKTLIENGLNEENIKISKVGGALETPLLCQQIAESLNHSGIITLGAVIKGETLHYDLVCNSSYQGIMEVQLKFGIPIVFGILTCDNVKQVENRCSKAGLNKGKEFALSTLLQIIRIKHEH